MKKAAFIIAIVVLIDQVVKIWVKTHMMLDQSIPVTDWFQIYFTENNGAAFGMELGGEWGKILLTLFRIGVVGVLFVWLRNMIRQKKANAFLIVCIALIIGGALGNIIDSLFYGSIFSSSEGQIAQFVTPGTGYKGFFHGEVVDMLYFPLFKGFLPDWIPIWGGKYFLFFPAIFNLADTAISIGIILLLLFQKKAFPVSSPIEIKTT